MAFEWKDEYSVHIKEIDDQHKKLLRLINKLEKCAGTGDFKDTVNHAFDELMEYVNIHFETEEYYLEKSNYSDLIKHQKIHNDIKEELNKKINHIINRDIIALDVIGLYNFLTKWLDKHILVEDQKYVSELKEHHDI